MARPSTNTAVSTSGTTPERQLNQYLGSIKRATRACDKHGDYSAIMVGDGALHGCPACFDERREKATNESLAKLAEERIGYTIHAEVSLEELEPEFAAMLAAGVVPTEQTPSGAFWSDAKRRVRLRVIDETQLSLAFGKPCECVTKVRKPRWQRSPGYACTCGALPGEGHALACARVLGEAA